MLSSDVLKLQGEVMDATDCGRWFQSLQVLGRNEWEYVDVLKRGTATFCAWSVRVEMYDGGVIKSERRRELL